MANQIPNKMRGWYLEEFGQPYVYKIDIPVPKPREDELLIKMEIAGYCHTETIVASGDYQSKLPLIPGHENVGIVASVGPKVQGFKLGDRVGCNCRECTRGYSTNFCAKAELAGLTHDGGMAEYLVADPRWTVKLPDNLSFEDAAPLMCAGSTMFNSIRNARQDKGAIIAIVGLGGLGHIGVQFAKAMGYKCVAIDIRPDPIALVSSFDPCLRPDLVLDPRDGPEHALSKILETFPGRTGVDAAVVSTDASEAFKFSTDILEKHGVLVVVGQPKEPIKFHWRVFVTQDISIVAGGLSQPDVMEEMMDLVVKEKIRSTVKVYMLEDVTQLVHDFHNPHMKGKYVIRIAT
ncbi:alcohol dehydrogenase [Venustampulla echinocandica]|uniref:Alcohol dehydrogenase n=1 Tax=Venustampulla echinocandica TaxID=2656787 RepID=A0A370TAN6_9HELO|nr:alcohol dehydrogenase [Venustampulla echinocandica]RDL30996.1 alcohol dehydrogenase [Venustampulla echinocandica]